MAARVLAVVAAVAMVAAAIAFREGRLGGDGGGFAVSTGGTTTALTCATEAAKICEALRERDPGLDVTTERAWVTADRILSGKPAPDVWLAPAPLTDLAPALDRVTPVAETALAALIPSGRTEPFGGCPVPNITWVCLRDAAGDGTRVRVTARDPHAVPALAAGAVAAAVLAGAELPAADVGEVHLSDPEVADSSGPLRGALGGRPVPFAGFIVRPSAADVVIGLRADADRAVKEAANGDRFRVVAPTPETQVRLVLATAPGFDPGTRKRLAAALTDSALALGWSKPTGGPTGLPSAGALVALRPASKEPI